MKMISRSVLAVAATFALVGAAHAADIVGAASPVTDAELYVAVGESQVNGGPHQAGKAGIGVGTVSNAKPVYFVGDRAGTTLPAGVATYSVAGLNKFNGSNLLSGTFRADFGSGKLLGGLTGGGLAINVNANINSANASFAGTATANGTVAGATQGQFFGANAATLAGIATFTGNSQYDTAFGGSKN
uniref:Transferrin-binding protein B C-lobe/N-lobe beta barrel domain-containing protein n=1 Tax=Panagrolaimus superbus TaxID=310955 RepID=A0A914YG34_9BILA